LSARVNDPCTAGLLIESTAVENLKKARAREREREREREKEKEKEKERVEREIEKERERERERGETPRRGVAEQTNVQSVARCALW
jgi:hypothetical protein